LSDYSCRGWPISRAPRGPAKIGAETRAPRIAVFFSVLGFDRNSDRSSRFTASALKSVAVVGILRRDAEGKIIRVSLLSGPGIFPDPFLRQGAARGRAGPREDSVLVQNSHRPPIFRKIRVAEERAALHSKPVVGGMPGRGWEKLIGGVHADAQGMVSGRRPVFFFGR